MRANEETKSHRASPHLVTATHMRFFVAFFFFSFFFYPPRDKIEKNIHK